MNRRKFLTGIVTAASISVAGCTDGDDEQEAENNDSESSDGNGEEETEEEVTAPQANYSISERDDGTQVLVHEGGDLIEADSVFVNGEGELADGEQYSAGDVIVEGIEETDQLVWEDPDSGQSLILFEL